MFDQFTNIYSLDKTLRFKLNPVGNTPDLLEQNQVLKKDQTIENSYQQAKPYLDELHRRLINEALTPENLRNFPFNEYAAAYEYIKEINRNRYSANNKKETAASNEWESKKSDFRKAVVDMLNQQADHWKQKYQDLEFNKGELERKGTNFLTSPAINKILKTEFPPEKEQELVDKGFPSLHVDEEENSGEKRYIFESFDKFATYLSRFQQTRQNLYTSEDKATAIATRVVANFTTFMQNIHEFRDKHSSIEDELNLSQDEKRIFEPVSYRHYVLQADIEEYNAVIGDINKRMKELRDQKHKNPNYKKTDYPLLSTLDKQILGLQEKEHQLIEDDEDVWPCVEELLNISEQHFPALQKSVNALSETFFEPELPNIYLKDKNVNTISNRWFVNGDDFLIRLPQKNKKKDEKDTPKIKTFISLQDVRTAIDDMEGVLFKDRFYEEGAISPDQSTWQQFLGIFQHELSNAMEEYYQSARSLREVKDADPAFDKEHHTPVIKEFADACLRVYRLLDYFALTHRQSSQIPDVFSTEFYEEFDAHFYEVNVPRYYNALRDYIAQVFYGEDKIKLNFGKGNLLGGWSESRRNGAQYCGYILRRPQTNTYYLAITDNPWILDTEKHSEIKDTSNGMYEKMEYSQLKAQTIYGPSYEGEFGVSYDTDKQNSTNQKIIERVKRLLQKNFVEQYPELQTIIDREYSDADALAREVSNQNLYRISFVPVSAEYIEQGRYEAKRGGYNHLYIFEITNKDLAKPHSGGNPNLHTSYFLHLFSQENLSNPVLKLSGNAEIFFRPGNHDLPTKTDSLGKQVTTHKRYSKDTLLFHLPVSINFKKGSMKPKQFNDITNQKIADQPKDNLNIIGIDRGEKHLVYYSVVDCHGRILDQGSLNEINGIDYHRLLDEREKERIKNRQSWEPIEDIKNLKKGYISHVVHALSRLAVEHNAIIVMEDLNMRFKQIRGGIEKGTYQRLERQLIDKLNYLVFKDRDARETGGILRGYQLTAPFESFEKMGKQTGTIFYTEAGYTSVTDPLTGFRKNIYLKNSDTVENLKQAINTFHTIEWDEQRESYYFRYDVADFSKSKDTPSRIWEVYANVPRIIRKKVDERWTAAPVNPNDLLAELLQTYDFENPYGDVLEQIRIKEEAGELKGEREFDGEQRNFYKSLVYIFNLILQLRNSMSHKYRVENDSVITEGEDLDFIASPVPPFFTTESSYSTANFGGFEQRFIGNPQAREKFMEEFNGDANGAYNIARKGVLLLDRVRENPSNPDIFITNQEWDRAATEWDTS
ncbi:type V CRISPR-associated protein Cpf1 [Candidatus Saccharibacteria bacterium QS_5_54_17]|nr:MAG: type V CRISPR-associated protein Cpf1 [Candidatus Saccharibacteria bacterium QS_5_54_17]